MCIIIHQEVQKMLCPNCHASVKENMSTCPQCAMQLNAKLNTSAALNLRDTPDSAGLIDTIASKRTTHKAPSPVAHPKKKGRSSKFITVLLTLGGLALAYIVIVQEEGKQSLKGASAILSLDSYALSAKYGPHLVGYNTAEKESNAVADNSSKADILPLSSTDKEVQAVISAQLAALQAGDISKAYFGFSSKTFQQATSIDALREFVHSFPLMSDFKVIIFGDAITSGEHVVVDASLKDDSSVLTLKYSLEKQDGAWKIFGFRILSPDVQPANSVRAQREEAIETITEQLKELHQPDISKAYYAYTTKEFQQATPFETFAEFIKHNSLFTAYTKLSFNAGIFTLGQAGQTPGQAMLTATLSSDKGAVSVAYVLVRDGGQWKVQGMEIEPVEAPSHIPYFNSEELQKTIEDQLKSFREGDLPKAYYDYTSKEFKHNTPFKEFEKFVLGHPELSESQGVVFYKFKFENEVGTFDGLLILNNGSTNPMRFRLSFEGDSWKILSLEILDPRESPFAAWQVNPVQPPAPSSSSEAPTPPGTSATPSEASDRASSVLEFLKVDLGSVIDDQGNIITPTSTFHQDFNKIYVNLYLRGGNPGDSISLEMEHMESGSKIPPVTAQLQSGGDAILAFVYTPPLKGWPKGTYHLYASSSSGASKTFTFSVD